MNLAEMADLVCTKVRTTDDESIAACKTYLQRRAEMIWNEALWRDSIIQTTVDLHPQAYTVNGVPVARDKLHVEGIFLCPHVVGKVLAVRTTENSMQNRSEEYFFLSDPDQFAISGTPLAYTILSPVCAQVGSYPAVSNGQAGYNYLSNQGYNAADRAVKFFLRWYDYNLKRMVEKWFDPSSPNDMDASFPRYLRLHSASDPIAAVFIERFVLESAVPTLRASVNWMNTEGTLADFGAVQIYKPFTEATPCQRIRLVNAPTMNTTVKILAKRRHTPLANDYDTPMITGSENCLLAYAQADMLELDGQYAQAQVKMNEGHALLAQVKNIETVQQSNYQQLQPTDGIGSDLIVGAVGWQKTNF